VRLYVHLFVVLLFTFESAAKTAEPIEMLLRMKTLVGIMSCRWESKLCNSGGMLAFGQYTDGKLLASAVYRCSSLEHQHLHLRDIGE